MGLQVLVAFEKLPKQNAVQQYSIVYPAKQLAGSDQDYLLEWHVEESSVPCPTQGTVGIDVRSFRWLRSNVGTRFREGYFQNGQTYMNRYERKRIEAFLRTFLQKLIFLGDQVVPRRHKNIYRELRVLDRPLQYSNFFLEHSRIFQFGEQRFRPKS